MNVKKRSIDHRLPRLPRAARRGRDRRCRHDQRNRRQRHASRRAEGRQAQRQGRKRQALQRRRERRARPAEAGNDLLVGGPARTSSRAAPGSDTARGDANDTIAATARRSGASRPRRRRPAASASPPPPPPPRRRSQPGSTAADAERHRVRRHSRHPDATGHRVDGVNTTCEQDCGGDSASRAEIDFG